MKKIFGILLLIALSNQVFAKEVWVSVGTDLATKGQKLFKSAFKDEKSFGDITVLKIEEDLLPTLSKYAHEDFHRCAGFIFHESEEDALKMVNDSKSQNFAKKFSFADYEISHADVVNPMIQSVEAVRIADMIRKMSSYQNRYYTSPTGTQSQEFVKTTWEKLVAGRSDATVSYFKHPSWSQPSVILKIQGKSNEIIVVGGHADSISGYFGGARARAPGADDNASGISSITEMIRVLTEHSYQPEKTLMFMAYSAEEVGLRGSKEIAAQMKSQNAPVIGVLQLDMTNFKGSNNDIVLMTDYTNEDQNRFIGKLIDTYVKVKWGQDKCGYACSDHASWHMNGYPASMPFEAQMSEMNHNIHTPNDTISLSGDNADHASKFARLGLSYIIELDQ